jgi:uncharacterized protein (TIGR02271 family)
MLDETMLESLRGTTVYDNDGEKIGKVQEIYLDDESNRPEWIAISTGWFGSNVSFVPIGSTQVSDDRVTVPYDKDMVKSAPNFDADQHLSPEEESELYAYYGMSYSSSADSYDSAVDARGTGTATTTTGTARRGGDAMTRSEERMHVGTESVETGRARLRKYVVTENVTQTVPVRREEVRVEREPVTDANVDDALRGPAISEAEHEVTLTEERPVVAKETVPVERVRLSKETRVDEETVSGDVRKEQIAADGVYPDDATDVTRDRVQR